MKALVLERYGHFEYQEVATPVPGPGEILIEVAYAGDNRPDALRRAGAYRAPPGASDLPGL